MDHRRLRDRDKRSFGYDDARAALNFSLKRAFPLRHDDSLTCLLQAIDQLDEAADRG